MLHVLPRSTLLSILCATTLARAATEDGGAEDPPLWAPTATISEVRNELTTYTTSPVARQRGRLTIQVDAWSLFPRTGEFVIQVNLPPGYTHAPGSYVADPAGCWLALAAADNFRCPNGQTPTDARLVAKFNVPAEPDPTAVFEVEVFARDATGNLVSVHRSQSAPIPVVRLGQIWNEAARAEFKVTDLNVKVTNSNELHKFRYDPFNDVGFPGEPFSILFEALGDNDRTTKARVNLTSPTYVEVDDQGPLPDGLKLTINGFVEMRIFDLTQQSEQDGLSQRAALDFAITTATGEPVTDITVTEVVWSIRPDPRDDSCNRQIPYVQIRPGRDTPFENSPAPDYFLEWEYVTAIDFDGFTLEFLDPVLFSTVPRNPQECPGL
jgi:hypothetical protein